MYCQKCGKEVSDQAVICVSCGSELSSQRRAMTNSDSSAFGFGVLGFFVPLAGIILGIMWNTDRPNRAHAALIGAIIGIVASVVLVILCYVLAFSIPLLFMFMEL
ncbi:MAG: zinc-ribbon domain-containing protein [Clostridia bacterium]|nr:zinc-ribbon domain-containing protein [Clostridia bacterium]